MEKIKLIGKDRIREEIAPPRTRRRRRRRAKSKETKDSVITLVTAPKKLGMELSIDKIEYMFEHPIQESKLISYLDNRKLEYEKIRLSNEYSIRCEKFDFIYLSNTKSLIRRISTNPNNENSFNDYYKKYNKIIDSDLEKELYVYRVDFALDFHKKQFSWYNQHLHISAKRCLERYVHNGSEEQTRYFGKGKNTSVLYEKRRTK